MNAANGIAFMFENVWKHMNWQAVNILLCSLQFSGPGREWRVVLSSVLAACHRGDRQRRRWYPRCETHKHHRPHQWVLPGEKHTYITSVILETDVVFAVMWSCLAHLGSFGWTDSLLTYGLHHAWRLTCCSSRQKFGDLTVRQIERLRCRHRIQVLQAHEDTTKENAVSRQRIEMCYRLSDCLT